MIWSFVVAGLVVLALLRWLAGFYFETGFKKGYGLALDHVDGLVVLMGAKAATEKLRGESSNPPPGPAPAK